MTEYTSLEVSKRLAEEGFDGIGGFDNVGYPFKWLERAPGDADLVEGWHGAESGDGPIAYRSDTLLDWLMHKPLFSLRTHSVDVKARGVRIVATGECELRLFVTATLGSGKTLEGDAPTLPDALAEVILKVLEVSNG
jgi:hypothetical protein